MPVPERDGLVAALRTIFGGEPALSDEIEARLTKLDDASDAVRGRHK